MPSSKSRAKSSSRGPGRPPLGTRGDTRQELLDAALRLFAQQGYAATTVRQIAEAVDVRDSAIYGHFDAKQDLLEALVDEAGPQVVDRLGIDFDALAERSPQDGLGELVEGLVSHWNRRRSRELISLMTREGLTGVADGVAHLSERLSTALKAWKKSGDLRSDIPAETLLWQFVAPLFAIRLLYLNAQAGRADRQRGKRLAQEHLEFFLTTTGSR